MTYVKIATVNVLIKMAELSFKSGQIGLIFIIGLTLFPCMATKPLSNLSVNSVNAFEEYDYFTTENNNKTIPTVASNGTEESDFPFCHSMPKFKLGSGSLLTYMMRLKLCYFVANKPWFEEACRQQLYGITDYHRAVYVKFCQPETFRSQCGSNGLDIASLVVRSWMHQYNVTERLFYEYVEDGDVVPKEDIMINNSTCITILSYFESVVSHEGIKMNRSLTHKHRKRDRNDPFGDVPFTEWFLTYRVFCDPVACGASYKNFQSRPLSAYDCFPSTCQSAINFTIIFDSVLAIITVVANLFVLAVAIRTTIMRNIPGFFKISLAIGDLMVGLFVLPGSVYHHYILSIAPLPFRGEGQPPLSTDYFNQHYLNFMGLFNVLSFSVSIYTLGAASIDRYLAVTKPFQYRNGKYLTKKRTAGVLAIVWSFSFLIAIYPVFIKNYNISAIGLMLSTGPVAMVIYSLTLGLPLLAVWVINGAMLRQIRTQKRSRRRFSLSRSRASPMPSEHLQPPLELNEPSLNDINETDSHKSQLPTSASVSDNVFESSENTNNNNCSKKNKQRKSQTKSASTSLFQHRPLSFVSSVHSQIRKKFNHSITNSLAKQANIERKLTKTLGVMVGAFTLALLPPILVLIFQLFISRLITPVYHPKSYSPSVTNSFTTAEYFASRLFLSNSFWNCIIYSIRNRPFRDALINVFVCNNQRRSIRHQAKNPMSYRSQYSHRPSKVSSTNDRHVSQATTKAI